jgi:hypothetical protein
MIKIHQEQQYGLHTWNMEETHIRDVMKHLIFENLANEAQRENKELQIVRFDIDSYQHNVGKNIIIKCDLKISNKQQQQQDVIIVTPDTTTALPKQKKAYKKKWTYQKTNGEPYNLLLVKGKVILDCGKRINEEGPFVDADGKIMLNRYKKPIKRPPYASKGVLKKINQLQQEVDAKRSLKRKAEESKSLENNSPCKKIKHN